MDTVVGICGVDGLGVYAAAWGVWAEQWERAKALNAARMEGRCVKSRPGGSRFSGGASLIFWSLKWKSEGRKPEEP